MNGRPTTAGAIPLSLALSCLLGATASRALELQDATQAELERLKGIGVELSERLLAQRRQAPFVDWNDLRRRVPGIQERLACQLSRQGLTVAGQPFAPSPTATIANCSSTEMRAKEGRR